MGQEHSFIFDSDNTLYRFGPNGSFNTSRFRADLQLRIVNFISHRLQMGLAEAGEVVKATEEQFSGAFSLGFERMYGIDRMEFYDATWNCDPADYIPRDALLADRMADFSGRSLLLTGSPRIWATKVLSHLGVAGIFGQNIITGEPDLRKPNPLVFGHAAMQLKAPPDRIVSIGDGYESDILPAKLLGMATLIVGPEQYDADYRADTIHDAIDVLKERFF